MCVLLHCQTRYVCIYECLYTSELQQTDMCVVWLASAELSGSVVVLVCWCCLNCWSPGAQLETHSSLFDPVHIGFCVYLYIFIYLLYEV